MIKPFLFLFFYFVNLGACEIRTPGFCQDANGPVSYTIINASMDTNFPPILPNSLKFPIWDKYQLERNQDRLIKQAEQSMGNPYMERRPDGPKLELPQDPVDFYQSKHMPEGGLLNYCKGWYGTSDAVFLTVGPTHGIGISGEYKLLFTQLQGNFGPNQINQLFIIDGPVDITPRVLSANANGNILIGSDSTGVFGLTGFGFIQNGSEMDKILDLMKQADLIKKVPNQEVFTTRLFLQESGTKELFPSTNLSIFNEEPDGIFLKLCRLRYEYAKETKKSGNLFRDFLFESSYKDVKSKFNDKEVVPEEHYPFFVRFIGEPIDLSLNTFNKYLVARYSFLSDPWYLVFSFQDDKLQRINLLNFPLTFYYQYNFLDTIVDQDSLKKSTTKRTFKDIYDIFHKKKGIDYEWVKKMQVVFDDKNSPLSLFFSIAAANTINDFKRKTIDSYVQQIYNVLKKADFSFDFDPQFGEAFYFDLGIQGGGRNPKDPFKKEFQDGNYRIFQNTDGFKCKVYATDATFFESNDSEGFKEFKGVNDLPKSPTSDLGEAFKKAMSQGQQLAGSSDAQYKDFRPVGCDVVGIEIYDQNTRYKYVFDKLAQKMVNEVSTLKTQLDQSKKQQINASQNAVDDFKGK